MRKLLTPLASLGALVAIAAASLSCTNLFSYDCAGVGMPGIIATIVTPGGAPAARGTTIITTDGAFADTVGPVVNFDSTLGLVENRGGAYTVKFTKPWWTTVTRQVSVPGGRCGYVETQKVRVTMDKLPGAPAVRSVGVSPRSTPFSFCGSGVRLEAYVDADSGLSTVVRWTTRDPTIATVTQDGIATIHARGKALVTATSVADPSVHGESVLETGSITPPSC